MFLISMFLVGTTPQSSLSMKIIVPAIFYAFVAFALSTNASAATIDGLAPCKPGESYQMETDSVIDEARAGKVLLGFTAYPSFEPEWGIRILQNAKNESLLRVVQFKKSVWYSAYQEHAKGTFQRDPSKANLERSVHEIPVSKELLGLLLKVVGREVAAASTANAQFGLDGESYKFTAGGKSCATTWSPDSDTRAGRLVAIFEALRVLPTTPFSLFRNYREGKIIARLREL
jgi:hypothetical protein